MANNNPAQNRAEAIKVPVAPDMLEFSMTGFNCFGSMVLQRTVNEMDVLADERSEVSLVTQRVLGVFACRFCGKNKEYTRDVEGRVNDASDEVIADARTECDRPTTVNLQ